MKSYRQLERVLPAALVAAVVVVVFMINPAGNPLLPSCPLHTLTGMYCPGCGSTRALHQLLHGHLVAAFRFNPLMVATLPLLGALVLKRDSLTVRPIWIWVLLGTVICFGILRNIPQYPFTMLVPQT